MTTGRPVLGSTVIANYITVTTDSKTSIHRGKGQNMLFVMLNQAVHNKMQGRKIHNQDKIIERIEELYCELYGSEQTIIIHTAPKDVPEITSWEVEEI